MYDIILNTIQMKTKKILLLSLVITLFLAACSKDSDDNINSTNLIIGEWLFISENDYRCGTDDEIISERLGVDNEFAHYVRYNADGTWDRKNGTQPFEFRGTWESLGNNRFEIFFELDNVTDTVPIEFSGNDVMHFNIDRQCIELANGESIHSFTVWTRQ